MKTRGRKTYQSPEIADLGELTELTRTHWSNPSPAPTPGPGGGSGSW